MAHHERFREILRAFKLRGGTRRSKNLEVRGAERVDDAGRQRRLGTHDGDCDGFAAREFNERSDIGQIDIRDARLARRPRIARRDEDHSNARRARELPRQRVLAAPAANDECVQRFKPSFDADLAEQIQDAAVVDAAVEVRNVRGQYLDLLRA